MVMRSAVTPILPSQPCSHPVLGSPPSSSSAGQEQEKPLPGGLSHPDDRHDPPIPTVGEHNKEMPEKASVTGQTGEVISPYY